MKVLNFKSNSVQERNNVSTISKAVDNIEKQPIQNHISDDIQIKNFKSIASKIKIDDTLDLETIEKLRDEIKNKSFTTEMIADSIIKNAKEYALYKRV